MLSAVVRSSSHVTTVQSAIHVAFLASRKADSSRPKVSLADIFLFLRHAVSVEFAEDFLDGILRVAYCVKSVPIEQWHWHGFRAIRICVGRYAGLHTIKQLLTHFMVSHHPFAAIWYNTRHGKRK